MEPVGGTDDEFVVTLPDGKRLALKGQVPSGDGDATFEVRKAPVEVLPSAAVYETTHMPGCGLTGPFIEGQHSGCSLCGTALELCGHSAAPMDGRCCDNCQQTRVLPRRIKTANLIGKLLHATMTPFHAIEARDAVMSELLASQQFREPSIIKGAMAAEIVAWDFGLQRAALRGAEAFDGTPWNAKPCDQVLLLENGLCVLLLNGEFEAQAIVVNVRDVRSAVQIATTKIRRGQLLSAADGAVWIDKGVPRSTMDLGRGMFWIDMAALQAFMELEVVQRESRQLPRQAVRSALRSGQPLPKVTVVRLRRVYAERQTSENDVEWQHRWTVRGHWRRQWYASTKEHKLIFIAPFIKGPEGKPFLPPRDVVKVVTR